MRAKALELRDRSTFIPILAIEMTAVNDDQAWLLRRCGYALEEGTLTILLMRLSGDGEACADPKRWSGRTFPVAHRWVIDNWAFLNDGDVVDVEFILGETKKPKPSERETKA